MGGMEDFPHDYPYIKYGRRALAFELHLDNPKARRASLKEGEQYTGESETFVWTEWSRWSSANLVVSAVVPKDPGYVFPTVVSKRLHLPVIDIDYPAEVEGNILWLGKSVDEEEVESIIEAFSLMKLIDYQSCDVLDRGDETGVSLLPSAHTKFTLVLSSNPDHRHMLIDTFLQHKDYLGEEGILSKLVSGGLVEAGYYSASVAHGCSAIRLHPKPSVEA